MAHNDIAGGFLDDGKGLQDRHTAGDQCSQSAGESRNGDFSGKTGPSTGIRSLK